MNLRAGLGGMRGGHGLEPRHHGGALPLERAVGGRRGRHLIVSPGLRLKDLLGPATRVEKKKKSPEFGWLTQLWPDFGWFT